MKIVVVVRLPQMGALTIVGDFLDTEAANAWIKERVGEGASAEVAMMWDPVASPRFG